MPNSKGVRGSKLWICEGILQPSPVCGLRSSRHLHRNAALSLDFAPPCPGTPISRVFAAISRAVVLTLALLVFARARPPFWPKSIDAPRPSHLDGAPRRTGPEAPLR